MPGAMDDLLISLADLAAAPPPRALVGGKAAGLARLVAAGVPVPAGVVLTTRAAALPAAEQDALLRTLEERARALGEVLAVRSSATIEDDVAAAAPGIFLSRLDVAPADVAAAVRAVWASAHAPLVRAYTRDRGMAHVDMAVIIQAQIGQPRGAGGVAGVAYTRPPGRPDAAEMLIETHAGARAPAAAARIPRAPAHPPEHPPDPGDLPLAPDTLAALMRVLLQAEDAIEAPRGADVEWVVDPGSAAAGGVWIVQARPIVHPPAAPGFPEALIQFSRAEPALVWHWDASHNPDPLSPAQAGLVERVDRAGLASSPMRVIGGYLYVASPLRTAAAPAPGGSREDARADAPEHDAEDLQRRFEHAWQPALAAALAAAEAPDADLAAVLDAYDRFYAVYAGELTARVSRARRALPAFLRAHGFDAPEPLAGTLLSDRSPARLETLITRVARGEAAFDALLAAAGPMSPAWDVAGPTYAETPALLRQAVDAAAARARQQPPSPAPAPAAEARVRAELDPGAHPAFARCLALARVARDIGELDDRLYARAQAAVRHALLRLARHWDLTPPDDIFFLPLDAVVAWTGEQHARPTRVALHRMARAARAARRRQRAWAMPLAFAGGRAVELHGPDGAPVTQAMPAGRDIWQGRGTGGRVRGTAVRVADLADLADIRCMTAGELGPDAILVVPAITPAMAILLQHAVAAIAEHGGLLGHGAAMARELGLPCVVDCARAWHDLRTGDALWLDGEAGRVVRTGHAPPDSHGG